MQTQHRRSRTGATAYRQGETTRLWSPPLEADQPTTAEQILAVLRKKYGNQHGTQYFRAWLAERSAGQ